VWLLQEPTFRRIESPPSSGFTSASWLQSEIVVGDSYEFVPIQELTTSLCNQLALVHPEDGGDTILRNVGSYKSHSAPSPRR
jgi:hypothetical protein